MALRRSEAILADEHGRDNVADAELALDKDGKFLGLRVKTFQCRGLYLVRPQHARDLRQCRHGRHLCHPGSVCAMPAVMTNTNATAPYRGAGRPEATMSSSA